MSAAAENGTGNGGAWTLYNAIAAEDWQLADRLRSQGNWGGSGGQSWSGSNYNFPNRSHHGDTGRNSGRERPYGNQGWGANARHNSYYYENRRNNNYNPQYSHNPTRHNGDNNNNTNNGNNGNNGNNSGSSGSTRCDDTARANNNSTNKTCDNKTSNNTCLGPNAVSAPDTIGTKAAVPPSAKGQAMLDQALAAMVAEGWDKTRGDMMAKNRRLFGIVPEYVEWLTEAFCLALKQIHQIQQEEDKKSSSGTRYFKMHEEEEDEEEQKAVDEDDDLEAAYSFNTFNLATNSNGSSPTGQANANQRQSLKGTAANDSCKENDFRGNFRTLPSVGTWLLPPKGVAAGDSQSGNCDHAAQRKEESNVRGNFRTLPSVGTWLLPPKAAGVGDSKSKNWDQGAQRKEESNFRINFRTLPSVGTWLLPPKAAAVGENKSENCDQATQTKEETDFCSNFSTLPSVGTWLLPQKGRGRHCPEQLSLEGKCLLASTKENGYRSGFCWLPSVGTWSLLPKVKQAPFQRTSCSLPAEQEPVRQAEDSSAPTPNEASPKTLMSPPKSASAQPTLLGRH